jgi:hypothetical protein
MEKRRTFLKALSALLIAFSVQGEALALSPKERKERRRKRRKAKMKRNKERRKNRKNRKHKH